MAAGNVVEFVDVGAKLVVDIPWNLALKITVNFRHCITKLAK